MPGEPLPGCRPINLESALHRSVVDGPDWELRIPEFVTAFFVGRCGPKSRVDAIRRLQVDGRTRDRLPSLIDGPTGDGNRCLRASG